MAGRMVSARVEGLESVIRRLKKLPERNRRHAMRPAVRKAATPVVKAAKRFAPKGDGLAPSGKPRKSLKKSITKTSVKWYRDNDAFVVTVGPEKNTAFHAHLVHNGTKPHLITLTKPKILETTTSLGRGKSGRFESVTQTAFLPAGFVFQHPGNKANPFLANAVTATRGQVQEILKKEILAGIDKQVQKLRKTK